MKIWVLISRNNSFHVKCKGRGDVPAMSGAELNPLELIPAPTRKMWPWSFWKPISLEIKWWQKQVPREECSLGAALHSWRGRIEQVQILWVGKAQKQAMDSDSGWGITGTPRTVSVQKRQHPEWARIWEKSPLVHWGYRQYRESPSEVRQSGDEGQSQILCRSVQTGRCKWTSG